MSRLIGLLVSLSLSTGVRSGAQAGVTADWEHGGLYGPQVRITRYENTFRGQMYGHTFDMDLGTTSIIGLSDLGPIKLSWSIINGKLLLSGLFIGRLGHLYFNGYEITGNIGNCEYDVRGRFPVYSGRRICDGNVQENTEVTLPEYIVEAPMSEKAAIIALMLIQPTEGGSPMSDTRGGMVGPAYDSFYGDDTGLPSWKRH